MPGYLDSIHHDGSSRYVRSVGEAAPRIRSIVGGDPARHRPAAALLLTYVGAPSIYYGDEIGLAGEGNEVRACMPWERADASLWDEDLRAFYQTLVRLRRTSRALIEGGFQVLSVEENTLAYLRDADEEQVVVIGHRGPGMRPAGPIPVAHGAIPDGAELVELFSGRQAKVVNGHLPLAALAPGVQVWARRRF